MKGARRQRSWHFHNLNKPLLDSQKTWVTLWHLPLSELFPCLYLYYCCLLLRYYHFLKIIEYLPEEYLEKLLHQKPDYSSNQHCSKYLFFHHLTDNFHASITSSSNFSVCFQRQFDISICKKVAVNANLLHFDVVVLKKIYLKNQLFSSSKTRYFTK